MVGTTLNKETYAITSASTGAMDIPFRYDDNSWIYAVAFSGDGETTTNLTLGSDFTLSGDGSQSLGEITLSADFLETISTATLVVYRIAPALQTLDLQYNTRLPAEALEAALDTLAMASIDRSNILQRTFTLPFSDPESFASSYVIESANERKGTVMAFSTVDGKPVRLTYAQIAPLILEYYGLEISSDDVLAAISAIAPIEISDVPGVNTPGKFGQLAIIPELVDLVISGTLSPAIGGTVLPWKVENNKWWFSTSGEDPATDGLSESVLVGWTGNSWSILYYVEGVAQSTAWVSLPGSWNDYPYPNNVPTWLPIGATGQPDITVTNVREARAWVNLALTGSPPDWKEIPLEGESPPDDTVYVLAIGQSNMARNNSGGIFGQASYDVNPDDRVQILNTATGEFVTWDLSVPGTNYGIGDKRVGATEEVSTTAFHFAKEVVRRKGGRVRIIASAKDGESLDYWGINTAGTALDEAATGWEWITSQISSVPRVDVILFQQGETLGGRSTSQQATGVSFFKEQLSFLDQVGSSCPFIACKTAFEVAQGSIALASVKASESPSFHLVEPPIGAILDSVHFTDDQIAQIGYRFADSFFGSYSNSPQLIHLGSFQSAFAATQQKYTLGITIPAGNLAFRGLYRIEMEQAQVAQRLTSHFEVLVNHAGSTSDWQVGINGKNTPLAGVAVEAINKTSTTCDVVLHFAPSFTGDSFWAASAYLDLSDEEYIAEKYDRAVTVFSASDEASAQYLSTGKAWSDLSPSYNQIATVAQDVTNSATLTDSLYLQRYLSPGTYSFETLELVGSQAFGTAGAKSALAFTGTGTLTGSIFKAGVSGTEPSGTAPSWSGSADAVTATVGSSTQSWLVQRRGSIVVTAGGILKVQFAQNNAVAANIARLYPGSFLRIEKQKL